MVTWLKCIKSENITTDFVEMHLVHWIMIQVTSFTSMSVIVEESSERKKLKTFQWIYKIIF